MKNILKKYLKFDSRLSVFLVITFIFMTVIGTLSHELGHCAVAKFLGYNVSIHYGSMNYWNDERENFFQKMYQKYPNEIKNNLDFSEKSIYLKNLKKYQSDSFWITFGGAFQTMLTGTIGFLLFLFYKKKIITTEKVHFWGWILIFLALFWLRQIANFFNVTMAYLIKGTISINGDEAKLAYYLGINIWTIQIITAIFGSGVLLTILYFLPKRIVLTFLISGLIGGVLGFYLWLVKFGEMIMP